MTELLIKKGIAETKRWLCSDRDMNNITSWINLIALQMNRSFVNQSLFMNWSIHLRINYVYSWSNWYVELIESKNWLFSDLSRWTIYHSYIFISSNLSNCCQVFKYDLFKLRSYIIPFRRLVCSIRSSWDERLDVLSSWKTWSQLWQVLWIRDVLRLVQIRFTESPSRDEKKSDTSKLACVRRWDKSCSDISTSKNYSTATTAV
jgi:hypothetical protein